MESPPMTQRLPVEPPPAPKSDRGSQGVLLTLAVAAGLVLAFLSVVRAPRKARTAGDPREARHAMASQMREMTLRDALPAHEVTELLQLLRRYRPRLYAMSTCPACMMQRALLTNFAPFIEVVNCGKQKELCKSANIRGLPTWEFPEGFSPPRHVGLLTKRDLLAVMRRHQATQDFLFLPRL